MFFFHFKMTNYFVSTVLSSRHVIIVHWVKLCLAVKSLNTLVSLLLKINYISLTLRKRSRDNGAYLFAVSWVHVVLQCPSDTNLDTPVQHH